MSSSGNNVKRTRKDELVVDPAGRPGWVSAGERVPRVGEQVYCVGGSGVVSAVLGKTSDGSRLMEIQLDEPGSRPFFATGSNVLVAPE